jgi:cell division protease FtsH
MERGAIIALFPMERRRRSDGKDVRNKTERFARRFLVGNLREAKDKGEDNVNSSSTAKTILFWISIVFLGVMLWKLVSANGSQAREQTPSYSEFMARVDNGDIKEVTLYLSPNSYEVQGEYRNPPNTKFVVTVFKEAAPDLVKQLKDKGAVIKGMKEVRSGDWILILLNAAPLILLVGFCLFLMRQMQAGGNKALSFGKSRARLLSAQQKKATFKDVAGTDEAKEELQEIIEFLKDPQKFQKLGGRIPKGVLLVGPPGTGKTLLARAIAGEANVPFFSISGSDFVEMFVGVGASRVRDLFEQGKKNAPCIIFIDEIDAVGRHRGAGLGGGHDEREQTLNALLVEMDGFESNEGVILIAATNRPDVLDPALLRPGRFDRRVVVARPDVKGREEILRVHTRKVPLADDVELSIIARGTPGFSGADLANLVNEAALWAARQNRKFVMQVDFEMSKDKVLMGVERKSMILSDEEKKNTAYHEAGHALVAAMTPGADPVHKVTIIPRGMALGLTMQLPEDDKHTYTREYLEAMLAVLMGGRSAEEIFLGHITTGAGNDIERATDLARNMVCEWGMSELGPLAYGKKDEAIFLGREITQHRDYSEDTAIQIDKEVKRIVNGGYENAKRILSGNRETLERIAQALLEREVIDALEVKMLMEGKPLPEKPRTPPPPTQAAPSTDPKVVRPELRPAPGFTRGENPAKA